ncbi:MAG: hypothetical protein ACYTDY_02615 [Planctomycetota bacterium]|jgi:hypothetical protein
MSGGLTRRGFLRTVLAGAGLAGLYAFGLAGRAARWTAGKLRIPGKTFDRGRLRDPHDLAG